MAEDTPEITKTRLRLIPSGPLMLEGSLRIEMPDGTIVEQDKAAICRCGASQSKPFCDGEHRAVDFDC